MPTISTSLTCTHDDKDRKPQQGQGLYGLAPGGLLEHLQGTQALQMGDPKPGNREFADCNATLGAG